MANSNEGMRDRLLSRLPQPENLREYRSEVTALLEKNQKTLRKQKWYSGAIWVYIVLFATAMFIGITYKPQSAAMMGTFTLLFAIYGAVELLKYFINRNRVELLKEIKQVQLQVLELQASLHK